MVFKNCEWKEYKVIVIISINTLTTYWNIYYIYIYIYIYHEVYYT